MFTTNEVQDKKRVNKSKKGQESDVHRDLLHWSMMEHHMEVKHPKDLLVKLHQVKRLSIFQGIFTSIRFLFSYMITLMIL